MKINLKAYFSLTLLNLYYFFIFNDQPRSYGAFFTVGFFISMVINQLFLVKMVSLMTEEGKGLRTFFYAIGKFVILATFFYFITTYFQDILILSIVSYSFQLIILVISIKRYVSKIRKNE